MGRPAKAWVGERKGGELGLIGEIERVFAGVQGRQVALGIGDDCAILRPRRGLEMVVTTDMTLEGRHFRRDAHPAEAVGHRCLARGLSDLAAMGARPVAAFLSLALPGRMLGEREGRRWVKRFLEGMQALAKQARVPLAGGDTAEAPGDLIMADIVLVGEAPRGGSLRRSGARVGDGIYVTGSLGGAAAELRGMLGKKQGTRDAGVLRGWRTEAVQRRHPQMFPQPRLAVGEALRRRALATACLDLSDGLSTDLRRLAKASGLGAEVWLSTVPVHGLAGGERGLALDGGEDYELLFTARGAIPEEVTGVGVRRIGTMVRVTRGAPLVTAVEEDGSRRELVEGGWEHFRGRREPAAGGGRA